MLFLLSANEKHIGRTSEVGSSNVQSLGMHKKSIEAAKALKDEDISCDDGEVNNSESERRSHHRHPLPVSSWLTSTQASITINWRRLTASR